MVSFFSYKENLYLDIYIGHVVGHSNYFCLMEDLKFKEKNQKAGKSKYQQGNLFQCICFLKHKT